MEAYLKEERYLDSIEEELRKKLKKPNSIEDIKTGIGAN